jgi:hypothetical protein
MTTRRTFIKIGVATGAGAYVTTKGLWSDDFSQVAGGTLPPEEGVVVTVDEGRDLRIRT